MVTGGESILLESQKGAQRQRSPRASPLESVNQQLFVHRLERRQKTQEAPRPNLKSLNLIRHENDDESRLLAIREAFRALSRSTDWDAGESRAAAAAPSPRLASDPRATAASASASVRKRLPVAKSATESRPFYQLARMPPLSAPEACGKTLARTATVRSRVMNASPQTATPIKRVGLQRGAAKANASSAHETDESSHADVKQQSSSSDGAETRATSSTSVCATRLRMTRSGERRPRHSSVVEERIEEFEHEVRRMELSRWGLAGGVVDAEGRASRMRGAHTLAEIRARFSRLPMIREEIDLSINTH